jgi:hypothetical protein
MAAPVQDQFGNNNGSFSGFNTSSTISAAAGSFIKLGALIVTNIFSGPQPTLSIVAAGGLTWTPLGSVQAISSINSRYYVLAAWTAPAPSGLSAATITVQSTLTIDCCMTAWQSTTGGVSPFIDTNAGALQQIVNNSGTPELQVGTYSTNFFDDQLFAFIGNNFANSINYSPSVVPPGGAVVTSNQSSGSGANEAVLGLITAPTTGLESGLTWGNDGSMGVPVSTWAFVGSALVGTPDKRQLFLGTGVF